MIFVNSLVAVVLADFKHPVNTADHQFFQIQLGRHAQIKVVIKRVVMRDERFGIRPAHNWMECRRFHFQKFLAVKELTHRGNNTAPRQQDFLSFVVDNQIDIALAIAGFHIRQPVEFLRQRLQRLGNNVKLLRRHRKFAPGRPADKPGNADDVADVKTFQEFQVIFRQMRLMAENLNIAALVFQVDKHTVVSDRHCPARNRYPVFGILSGRQFLVFFLQRFGKAVRLKPVRIRIVAHFFKFRQLVQAALSLFTDFFCHNHPCLKL